MSILAPTPLHVYSGTFSPQTEEKMDTFKMRISITRVLYYKVLCRKQFVMFRRA